MLIETLFMFILLTVEYGFLYVVNLFLPDMLKDDATWALTLGVARWAFGLLLLVFLVLRLFRFALEWSGLITASIQVLLHTRPQANSAVSGDMDEIRVEGTEDEVQRDGRLVAGVTFKPESRVVMVRDILLRARSFIQTWWWNVGFLIVFFLPFAFQSHDLHGALIALAPAALLLIGLNLVVFSALSTRSWGEPPLDQRTP
jgi:hypothetical protein